ncbi:MAG: phosphonate ABC transporter, permease protein PhnE [Anaerolineaceae bacterium]
MERFHRFLSPLRTLLIIVIAVAALIVSVEVTQPDPVKLIISAPKAKVILKQLLSPEILTHQASGTSVLSVDFPVPCDSAPAGELPTSGARIQLSAPCADKMQKVTLKGLDLEPETDVQLRWVLPNGSPFSIAKIKTDANGEFTYEVQARPIVATADGKPAQLQAEVSTRSGKYVLSQTMIDVTNSLIVTIFMALLATTFGVIFAVPMGFLAASNITRRGCVGSAVYYVVRAILNIIRSYEPLVMATIFALLTEFGSPFAGVLALFIVTTASLGKMFSEAVESIDSGPIEALTTTGANRMQVIVYAVIPQIVPDFLSFTIYHWDINIRISTIIGFVGGGGIGYYLSQRINTFEYTKAGTAILMIVIVVWVLDFLSARIRQKLT